MFGAAPDAMLALQEEPNPPWTDRRTRRPHRPGAARFGYDSRDGYASQEQHLAAYGMTWHELEHQELLAAEIEAARRVVRPTFPTEAHSRPVLA